MMIYCRTDQQTETNWKMIRLAYTSLVVIGQPAMKHERKKTQQHAQPSGFACAPRFYGSSSDARQHLHQPFPNHAAMLRTPAPALYGWWFVRFRMDRPAEKTRWEKDLLIAHQVTSPLIRAHDGDIELMAFSPSFC
jgi:hypothetical protein